jgi:C-terminal processing protease CtpA/Prc
MRLGSGLTKRLGDNWLALRSEADPTSDTGFGLGARKSFVPDLGTLVWESAQSATESGFTSRIFQIGDGRKIGFVRFPKFDYDEKVVARFGEVITRLQNETQALVVDVTDNPGGSMFQMYAMISFLTDRSLSVPKHEMRFDQDDVDAAAEVVARADAGQLEPDDTPELIAYSRFIVSEVKAGRGLGKLNTVPEYLGGIGEIAPSKNPYTRKLVVLINELTFSAAEFLAAIFQDNKRATLFGARTAGAGGCARRIRLPLFKEVGIDYMTLTWTLAWRTNGQPIENVGVTPDVPYSISVDDLRFDYQNYRNALLATI